MVVLELEGVRERAATSTGSILGRKMGEVYIIERDTSLAGLTGNKLKEGAGKGRCADLCRPTSDMGRLMSAQLCRSGVGTGRQSLSTGGLNAVNGWVIARSRRIPRETRDSGYFPWRCEERWTSMRQIHFSGDVGGDLEVSEADGKKEARPYGVWNQGMRGRLRKNWVEDVRCGFKMGECGCAKHAVVAYAVRNVYNLSGKWAGDEIVVNVTGDNPMRMRIWQNMEASSGCGADTECFGQVSTSIMVEASNCSCNCDTTVFDKSLAAVELNLSRQKSQIRDPDTACWTTLPAAVRIPPLSGREAGVGLGASVWMIEQVAEIPGEPVKWNSRPWVRIGLGRKVKCDSGRIGRDAVAGCKKKCGIRDASPRK
ncbi:hypothetical protein DFH06DRAFT_1123951 [Mycena polygramma]|nr:hypothetical protein DFH06DRAFT_1123951 [Mycena polygramma]